MSKRTPQDKPHDDPVIPSKGKADFPAQFADHLNPSNSQRKGKGNVVELTVEAESSDPLHVLHALRAHLAQIIKTAQQVNALELPAEVVASVHQLSEFVQVIEFQVADAIQELKEDRAIGEASIEPEPEPPKEGEEPCRGCRQPIAIGEPCPHCGTVRCVQCGQMASDPGARPWLAWRDDLGVCERCAATPKAAAVLLQQHIDARAGGAA